MGAEGSRRASSGFAPTGVLGAGSTGVGTAGAVTTGGVDGVGIAATGGEIAIATGGKADADVAATGKGAGASILGTTSVPGLGASTCSVTRPARSVFGRPAKASSWSFSFNTRWV